MGRLLKEVLWLKLLGKNVKSGTEVRHAYSETNTPNTIRAGSNFTSHKVEETDI